MPSLRRFRSAQVSLGQGASSPLRRKKIQIAAKVTAEGLSRNMYGLKPSFEPALDYANVEAARTARPDRDGAAEPEWVYCPASQLSPGPKATGPAERREP